MSMFASWRSRPRRVFGSAVVILMLVVGTVAVIYDSRQPKPERESADSEEIEGRVEREPVIRRPTVEAAFASESYRPGGTAMLVLFDSARHVTVRLFRVSDARGLLHAGGVMRGVPSSASRTFAGVVPGQVIPIRLSASLPTALYFVRLTAPGGRIGYAPFVLAPKQLGEHRIAVVLPTQTWQAYNYRDDDGDGTPNTWYFSASIHSARLYRPFENRGVPPYYHYYDEPFLRWVAHEGYEVDYLSDAELKNTTGAALARAYDLLIFSGHHEYVTTHEYDAVVRFRDLGGSLMFLSANNFFYKITITGGTMTRVAEWRDMGRPEAALVGVEYYNYDHTGRGGSPWILRNAPAGRWIFAGTGLRSGSKLSSGGIEADSVSASSPHGTQVLAEIPDLFGGKAQMTYYETNGAKVFAAGAFSLACSIWQPPVRRMIANLIARLSPPARE